MRKRAPVPLRSALGRSIRVHDRQQFELKLEYQPSPGQRHNRYLVEMFICVPRSLNISPDTLPAEAVYGHLHNYVRLKTPDMSWSELLALTDSPLVIMDELLEGLARGEGEGRFIYECKMFGSVFRANVRDIVDEVARSLAAGTPIKIVAAALDEGIVEARSVLARFREIHDQVRQLSPARARGACALADEYASVAMEQNLRRAIVALDRAGRPEAEVNPLKDRLLAVILSEEAHRKLHKYPSIVDPAGDNEAYVYRGGLLKKFCSSALFLQVHQRGARKGYQELLFAVAAGIAMAFATVVAFWAQARYAEVALFAILVGAYMFKDRLKEATRTFFSEVLRKTLYDRKISLVDPAGGQLGVCLEKMEYVTPRLIPAQVSALRRQGLDDAGRIAEEELQETVVHYKRQMVLSSRKLLGRRRGGGLTDIVRVHIARLLRDMDEPEQEIEFVELSTLRVAAVRASKVYHVDVVLRFETEGRAPETTVTRLILDRRGIKRIIELV
jgi:hypothetical protein